MKSNYLLHDDNGDWFALLPNNQYKKIPYINWVEDVDWSTIYYKVYQSLLNETIRCKVVNMKDYFELFELIGAMIILIFFVYLPIISFFTWLLELFL